MSENTVKQNVITELTPEQEALLPVYRDRYIAIGLCCEPAEWEKAEDAIKRAYAVVGDLEPPTKFHRVASPMAGARLAAQIETGKENPTSSDLAGCLTSISWGQHDVSWLSFYAYFYEVLGVEAAGKLQPLTDLAKAAGWCWFFKGEAVISDRPEYIKKDAQGRLHCEDGPAIRYRDGFAVYAWHGYRIPAKLEWAIDRKEDVTADTIRGESNAELRRVLCEITAYKPIYDIATVLSEDKDTNGNPRRLLSVDFDGDTVRFVEVVNGTTEPDGTRRKFLLGVVEGETPQMAVAASFGIKPQFFTEGCRT